MNLGRFLTVDIIKLTPQSVTQAQFARLVQLELDCGLPPYTPEMLRACIAQMDTYCAICDETTVGFITVHPSSQKLGGGLYIVNLNVAASHRRQGIGTCLLRAGCAQYSVTHGGCQVWLDVEKKNDPARSLYKKLGFRETALPSGNGDTDIVMTCALDNLLGTVHTERLCLRPIALFELPQMLPILQSDLVNRTYMLPDLTQQEAYALAKRMALLSVAGDRYVRGIYQDSQLVGWLNDIATEGQTMELGWVIAPVYHNKGYATEAVRAAITDLKKRGIHKVLAGAFAENRASIRVMEKAGMLRQGQTEQIDYRGSMHQCVYYATAE